MTTLTWCAIGIAPWLLAILLIVLFFQGAHQNNDFCKPKLYPMYCVWPGCNGRKTVTGWSSIEGSSGICPECEKEWLREFKETK